MLLCYANKNKALKMFISKFSSRGSTDKQYFEVQNINVSNFCLTLQNLEFF